MTVVNSELLVQDKIGDFVGNKSKAYYESEFDKINDSPKFVFSWNWMTFLFGPVWFGTYGIFSWALVFTTFEAFALTQIGRGLWGDLTRDIRDRIDTVTIQLNLRQAQLEQAIEDSKSNVDALQRNIEGLQAIIEQSQVDMQRAADSAIWYLVLGVVMIIALRACEATLANPVLARRYNTWLSDQSARSPKDMQNLVFSVVFVFCIFAINMAHYVFLIDFNVLSEFPRDPEFRNFSVAIIEGIFDYLTIYGDSLFDAISFGIRIVLDFLETLFVQTPWPVIAILIVIVTALAANRWAAVTAAIFLVFIGSVGLWTLAMQTLALLGTAACISIGIGIPIGIYSAHRPKVYRAIRPILDMQQTIPTFVYMIPIIAFFGTGKSAAVVTCLIFGMPPVVRLTVLGIQGVPDSIREAAIAYGASEWFLMTRIELPLAAPSIRAGINQTILLSLLTVVVASLIGAKGLGEDVLEALQYASIGQGLLAGLAILFLAKILDRIFRGNRDGV